MLINVVTLVLAVLAIICAFQAMHAQKLLSSSLWLAGVSAATAAILYLLGAYQVAVIELSVGAGLVTVLFVFAISIAGESTWDPFSIIPKPLAWTLVGGVIALLAWLVLTPPAQQPVADSLALEVMLWQGRGIDVLVQVALIFSGVISILGLLTGVYSRPQHGMAVMKIVDESETEHAPETAPRAAAAQLAQETPVVEEVRA